MKCWYEAAAYATFMRRSLPYDSILPMGQAQTRMFERLGTPAAQRRHVILESGHAVTGPEVRLLLIKEVLDWLDRHVGGDVSRW